MALSILMLRPVNIVVSMFAKGQAAALWRLKLLEHFEDGLQINLSTSSVQNLFNSPHG